MNSPENEPSFGRIRRQYWDSRLLPVLIIVLMFAAWDFTSRVMAGGIDISSGVSPQKSDSHKAVINRPMLRSEAVSLLAYIDTFAPKVIVSSVDDDDVGLDLQLTTLNEQLYGKAGFRLLAIFDGLVTFAVIERLDKSTQERELIEASVGTAINGYKIETVSKGQIVAVDEAGDQVTMVLFKRNAYIESLPGGE